MNIERIHNLCRVILLGIDNVESCARRENVGRRCR